MGERRVGVAAETQDRRYRRPVEPTLLAVTAVEEPGFTVHLEPEGMTYEVVPGSGLLLRFEASPAGQPVEVSWSTRGLIVGRPHDAKATATTGGGTPLDW
jgi:hypothetical protein